MSTDYMINMYLDRRMIDLADMYNLDGDAFEPILPRATLLKDFKFDPDCGYEPDLVKVNDKVRYLRNLTQKDFNTVYMVLRHFNKQHEVYTPRAQGLFGLLHVSMTKILSAAPKTSVQFEEVIIPALGMGNVCEGAAELFSANGRNYEECKKKHGWSDVVVSDYVTYVDSELVASSVTGMRDEKVSVYLSELEYVHKLLPLGVRIYIPHDVCGLISLVMRKNGHSVYSSDSNDLSTLSLKLGLVNADRNFSNKFDDGVTLLLLINVPKNFVYSWKGPILLWQYFCDRVLSKEYPGSFGRCYYQNFFIKDFIPFPGPVISPKIVRKLMSHMLRVGNMDGVIVLDNSMVPYIRSLKVPILKSSPKCLLIGEGKNCFNIRTGQDFAQLNNSYVYFGNLGDIVWIYGHRVVVISYGKFSRIFGNKLCSYTFLPRSNNFVKIYEDEGQFFVNVDVRVREFDGVYNGEISRVKRLSHEPYPPYEVGFVFNPGLLKTVVEV